MWEILLAPGPSGEVSFKEDFCIIYCRTLGKCHQRVPSPDPVLRRPAKHLQLEEMMRALVPLVSPFPLLPPCRSPRFPLLHPCRSRTCFQPDMNAHTFPARSPLGTALVTQLVNVSSGPTFIWIHFFPAQPPLPSAGVWANSTAKSFSQRLLQSLHVSSTRSCNVLQRSGSDRWVGSETVLPLVGGDFPWSTSLQRWINIICAQGLVSGLCVMLAQLQRMKFTPLLHEAWYIF